MTETVDTENGPGPTPSSPSASGLPFPDSTSGGAEAITAEQPVLVRLDPPEVGGDPRLRLYVGDRPATLSAIVPLLERLGLVVLDEHTETFTSATGVPVWMHDVGVRHPQASKLVAPAVRREVEHAFLALWRGDLEADGFNRLIVAAGITGAQVAVVRAYARYLLQISTPYSLGYLEDVLVKHADLTRRLIDLFVARFDPRLDTERAADTASIEAELRERLDRVASLDEDRIVRTFLTLVLATDRTNAFRPSDGRPGAGALALKFDPARVPDLPLPRPRAEIWVSSPRVEGVHLRGGRIARGGLRWSDRKEDFRTEVLGLMKAQMVKNAVIVPVGAKGGFVVKRHESMAGDPEAQRAEVVACYRTFVGCLLDLTDNIVHDENGDRVVPPPAVVRHDGDDPYLVVAADKGTATFSDIANDVAESYGFWLGDAFASGGRTGYDHKTMAITARGAWESVRRHFRSLGRDADHDEIVVVGIGDMSGDVFGNGLLRSPFCQLVAAFDHRHVFLDPDPDPAASYRERQRLFALPRSSWVDYDTALISEGGGVFARSAKSIPLTPAVRRRLGTSAAALTPADLVSAILEAPVDLLWNGGIGTYVKAASEDHDDVGDRANDAVRVDGADLRCLVVGEGGNLGFTQQGRIEAALAGVLLNTDAIDNSAGVDCSDHEVNIKVLLDVDVAAGRLTVDDRNTLLASMTDEVAELVLDDNRAQTLELAIARRQAPLLIDLHGRYLRVLEAEGLVNRELERLPSDKQIADRSMAGIGLTTPEFAVLLAYTKTTNIAELLASDLPDDPYVKPALSGYFPAALRDRFADGISRHRLRREIIATVLTNELVNHAGITFDQRMTEETGASVADSTRAWLAARDIFGLDRWWSRIEALPNSVAPEMQLGLFIEARLMVERGALWLLGHRRPPLDVNLAIARYRPAITALGDGWHQFLVGSVAGDTQAAVARFTGGRVPLELARRAASWGRMNVALDLADVATARGRSIEDTASTFWLVFEQLDLEWLWGQIGRLPRAGRWQNQARSSLRDDLLGALRSLTDTVLRAGDAFDAPNVLVTSWTQADRRTIDRASGVLSQLHAATTHDVTSLTAAVRQLRNLVATTSV